MFFCLHDSLYRSPIFQILSEMFFCLQEVEIQKDTNEKLGISIRGGSKGSKGNPLDVDDEGIFISKVRHLLVSCVHINCDHTVSS